MHNIPLTQSMMSFYKILGGGSIHGTYVVAPEDGVTVAATNLHAGPRIDVTLLCQTIKVGDSLVDSGLACFAPSLPCHPDTILIL